ncbi:MAG TPA: malectin domain-containing carbohydrate-binding protein, partial [Kiritimatiellia bacterium]
MSVLAASAVAFAGVWTVHGEEVAVAGGTPAVSAEPTNLAVRVNCGGMKHADRLGHVFEADAAFSAGRGWGYIGGQSSSAKSGVTTADADEPPLFLTDRWGADAYRFEMKPGVYRVTLFFSEYHFAESGKRVFDVLVNGRPVVKALDLVDRVGQNHAFSASVVLLAADGKIVVTTSDIVDKAKFSAMAVEPATPDQVPPPMPAAPLVYNRDREAGLEWTGVEAEDLMGYVVYRSELHDGTYTRINEDAVASPYYVDKRLRNDQPYFYRVAAVDFFGNESGQGEIIEAKPRAPTPQDLVLGLNVGGAAATDAKGRIFAADREYNPANGAGYVAAGRPRLGQDQAAGEPSLSVREGTVSYRYDLPPGIYKVTLGFYDAWAREARDRVFQVYLNQFRAFTDFDIVALYGSSLPVEVARTFRVGSNGLVISLAKKYGQPALAFAYVESAEADTTAPAAPSMTRQVARDAIAYVEWAPVNEQDVVGYTLLRAEGESTGFAMVTNGLIGTTSFVDTSVKNGVAYRYEVSAMDASGNESPASQRVVAAPHMPDDAELLDIIQRAAFEYFVKECDPKTFLTKDKNVADEISVASIGFGLSAYAVGAERGWMAKEEAENRVYLMLRALNTKEDNKEFGLFFHYLRGDGSRSAHGYEDAVSTVDTALLMWGAIGAGEYFGGRVKEESDLMMSRMNWKAFSNESRKLVTMAYRPAAQKFDSLWDYYTDEALLVTLLGISAPKEEFRLPPQYFYSFKRDRKTYKGIPDIVCSWSGSLFTYAFAHCWLDFQKLGPDNPAAIGLAPELQVNWWENSIKAIKANREFCLAMAKKYKTFGENAWGLSASSGPDNKYTVTGSPPCGDSANAGEGTLALYGAGMSVPFLPAESIAALRNYYTMRGENGDKLLWRDEFDGGYGFIDSFNVDKKFYSK